MGVTDINGRIVSGCVYDYLIVESERFLGMAVPDRDLYFKDSRTGKYVKVALAYNKDVETLSNKLFQRRKMRFFVTFNDTLLLEDGLTRMELRVIRYFARVMSYNNEVQGVGYNDLQMELGSQFRYIKKAIDSLISKKVLKFKTVKNRRIYMLNPSFYYKGNMLGIFRAVSKFDKFK